MRTRAIALAAAMAMLTPVIGAAHEAGDFYMRFGFSNVDPEDDNGSLNLAAVDPALGKPDIEVDDAWSFTFTGSYQMTDNWAVELLAAYPFEHDIKLDGVGKVGKTKHLPPTLSLQYHFLPAAKFQPYVGAGVNYTIFFDDEADGTLDAIGGDLSIEDDSFGFAAQIGADWMLGERWFLNADIRYIAIDTEAKVRLPADPDSDFPGGSLKANVDINPFVYGLNVGFKF